MNRKSSISKKPSKSTVAHSNRTKKPWTQKMAVKKDMLTLTFPLKKELGWSDKPKKEDQWEALINETCVFDFLLHGPIVGIVDDYDEDAIYIYHAMDLTRGTIVDDGSIALNTEAIRKVYVIENWYIYKAKRAIKRVKRDALDTLPNEFAAWHARCITKLSPYVEESSLAETVCMLEDFVDMYLEDGTAYKGEKETDKRAITESEAAELAKAVKTIDDLHKQQKIREDYSMMLAESITRIAEIIGAIMPRIRDVDSDLKGDRDLYDLAMMHNDFLKDSIEMYSDEKEKS